MSDRRIDADAVVVGAGTAGANAAYQLAVTGMAVVVLERRSLEHGGAQWHNGVLDWQFERAGIPRPQPPERVAERGTMHLLGPDGTHGVTVTPTPIVTANMTLLGNRLRSMAAEHAVEMIGEISDVTAEWRGDRVVAVRARTGPDEASSGAIRITAPLFVDASGRHGILRRQCRTLVRWCPPVTGDELCSASDFHLEITDPDKARGFLERHGANPGENVTVVGRHGGFSTRGITVSHDLDEVAVLVGCLANGRYGTGPRLLDELRADEPWIGEPTMGGSGVIPLRRPYARFTAPGLALVGDAACQVFPAHGSGIGMGLIAGRMLADTVADATDPGCEQTLWSYQASFQREFGGPLAAFDAFRRMSTALGTDGVRIMIRAGLMSEQMAFTGLDQRWATPPISDTPAMARKLAREPKLATRMVPMLARGQLLARVGRRYPSEVDEAALGRWDRQVERLLGRLPS